MLSPLKRWAVLPTVYDQLERSTTNGFFMAEYDGETRPVRRDRGAAAAGFPAPMMTVADIARRLALSSDHVRERVVTLADFPRPAFQIGRTRRWEVAGLARCPSQR